MLTAAEGFKNIQVIRDCGCDALLIASPPRIRQLIVSLLTNAMESGAQCVRIRVRMGWDWHHGSRGGVRITVADNGRGIAPEFRKKIFEPFFTTKGERGTGLGLWASRATVIKDEGTIRFRSTTKGQGSGTCMRVFLPTVPPNFDKGVFQRQSRSVHPQRSAIPA